MFKIAKLAAALPILAAVVFAPAALAAGPGQIEGGNIYRIKNVTKGSDFADPASADPGDTLLYRVRIHNPGEACLTNVIVKATLPQGVNQTHVSTVTVKADVATTNFISDTATLNLSSAQSLSYVSGSTQLLDHNAAVIKSLPDGILQNGVNIGDVCISLQNRRLVQFEVKVSKPQPPVEHKFACEALDVTKVSRTRFDFTARASATNATVQSYVFTAKDANGNVVDTQTVNTSALSANYSFNRDVAGTYTISVVVKTNKGDAPVGNCVKQVTVEEAPTPPVVSGKVTEIPVTGPGAVVGIFAGASALAGIGHYIFRRYMG